MVISSLFSHSSESLESIEVTEDSLELLAFLGLLSLFFPLIYLFHWVFTRAWNSFSNAELTLVYHSSLKLCYSKSAILYLWWQVQSSILLLEFNYSHVRETLSKVFKICLVVSRLLSSLTHFKLIHVQIAVNRLRQTRKSAIMR